MDARKNPRRPEQVANAGETPPVHGTGIGSYGRPGRGEARKNPRRTTESEVNLDAGTLAYVGTGVQTLEVAGEDRGAAGVSTANFGVGHLVVGQVGQNTRSR